MQANPDHVLASFDVSNAFLNAELSEDVVILTQPALEPIQVGLVKPGTLYQCTKACCGLRDAPSVGRGKRQDLCAYTFELNGEVYRLHQVHIIQAFGLWRKLHAWISNPLHDYQKLSYLMLLWSSNTWLVYVDEFLAAGRCSVLQPLLNQLLQLWKGSSPDFLGRDEGYVDSLRFLGLDVELGTKKGTWMVHQQSYIYAFLKEMCGFDCLKGRKTPAQPETCSTRTDVQANKAKPKKAILDTTLEHMPVLRLVVFFCGCH